MTVEENRILIEWRVEDVQEDRPDLTDDEAMRVLCHVYDNYDSHSGITWDTLEYWTAKLYPTDSDDWEEVWSP